MLEATPIPVAAGSLVVGVITFVVTEVGKWRRARRAETRQWQLDTLGTILSENGSREKDFRTIKAQYLQAAEIHKDFDISKQYKQDNEIQRALFELQSKGIISQDNAGYYRVKRDQTESEIEEKLSKNQQDVKKLMDEVMTNVMQQAAESQKSSLEQIQAQTKSNLEHLMSNIQNFQTTFVDLLQKQEEKIETYHNEEQKHKIIQKSLLELVAKAPGVYTNDEACVEVMEATKQDRVYVVIQLINLFTTGVIQADAAGRLRLALYAIKPSEMAALPAQ